MRVNETGEQVGQIERYELDFQIKVLYLFCINIKFSSQYLEVSTPILFKRANHKTIFNVIKRYFIKYRTEIERNDLINAAVDYLDNKGASEEFIEGIIQDIRYIFQTNINNEEYIVDRYSDFVKRRDVEDALLKSVKIIESGDELEKVLTIVNNAFNKGYNMGSGVSFKDIYSLPRTLNEHYNPSKLIKTGFSEYDSAMMGGMAPGELHVIMGTPKIGKSSFACNTSMFSLFEGKSVFHATLEISETQVLSRYASKLTGLTASEIGNRPELFTEKMAKFKNNNFNLYVKKWGEKEATTLDIRAWISGIQNKYDVTPGLIIVDWDDCLRPTTGGTQSLYEDSGQIYNDLLSLSEYFNAPVMTFAQPTREAWRFPDEGKHITNEYISHSARKIHKCYSVSSLNFKEFEDDGILLLDLNRRGKSHVIIPIRRNLDIASFSEIKQ